MPSYHLTLNDSDSSPINGSSSNPSKALEIATTTLFNEDLRSAEQRLRDAMAELRALGVIRNVDDAARLGAAVMIERCCREFQRRDVGPGWLYEAVRQGGSWCSADRSPSASQLLRELWAS
jgi:hypothetical protein